jgi:predicted nucleotidyltransferase
VASVLSIDAAQLAAVCRRHSIRRLALFGSVLKGRDTPQSDVDLLVEFLPQARPTFLDLAQIELELSPLVGGRRVDVRTAEDLSQYFRDQVVREAEVQFDAG